jgi:hypothetical protein
MSLDIDLDQLVDQQDKEDYNEWFFQSEKKDQCKNKERLHMVTFPFVNYSQN